MARLLYGKGLSDRLLGRVSEQIVSLRRSHGVVPGLAVLLVGHQPQAPATILSGEPPPTQDQHKHHGNELYVRFKTKAASQLGMSTVEFRLPESASHEDCVQVVNRCNADPSIHGILVQVSTYISMFPKVIAIM